MKQKKYDDPAQSKRFIEMARELGEDETGEKFERAAKRVTRPRPKSAGVARPERQGRS